METTTGVGATREPATEVNTPPPQGAKVIRHTDEEDEEDEEDGEDEEDEAHEDQDRDAERVDNITTRSKSKTLLDLESGAIIHGSQSETTGDKQSRNQVLIDKGGETLVPNETPAPNNNNATGVGDRQSKVASSCKRKWFMIEILDNEDDDISISNHKDIKKLCQEIANELGDGKNINPHMVRRLVLGLCKIINVDSQLV